VNLYEVTVIRITMYFCKNKNKIFLRLIKLGQEDTGYIDYRELQVCEVNFNFIAHLNVINEYKICTLDAHTVHHSFFY